jgi:hypothetical protein
VAQRPTAKDAYLEGKLSLPPGYGLEHGADVLLLRRADGSVAATFSAEGAAPAEVVRTAEGDHERNHKGNHKRSTRERPLGRLGDKGKR